jgi:hypothetical protein
MCNDMISFKKIKIQGKTTDTTIILNPFLGETGQNDRRFCEGPNNLSKHWEGPMKTRVLA